MVLFSLMAIFAASSFQAVRTRQRSAAGSSPASGRHRNFPFTVYRSHLIFPAVRTGGRVAEGVGLENRYTRKGIVGSNPTLSVLLLQLG